MNPQDQQQIQEIIKDTVYMATQATKRENSNLVGDIKIHLSKQDTILEEIRLEQGRVKDELVRQKETNAAHYQADSEWKVKAEPIIQLGTDMKGASKVVLYCTGIIVAIGGAFLMIKEFFK